MSDGKDIVLSRSELESFAQNGLLTIKHPAIAALKQTIGQILKEMSLKIMGRFEEGAAAKAELEDASFATLVDWCVANEDGQEISRAFYELHPVEPKIISLVSDTLFIDIAQQLGLETPIPSTLPVMRFDRPEDERFQLSAHQDFWASMLSANSIVYWLPVVPLFPDMGLLQAIPGSHKWGVLPFKETSYKGALRTVDEYPDMDYVDLPVDEDELLVFSQLLVHRSGANRSQKTRVSLQLRFNDLATLDAMTSSFTSTHSRHVEEHRAALLDAES